MKMWKNKVFLPVHLDITKSIVLQFQKITEYIPGILETITAI